jgi:hypothetical protein
MAADVANATRNEAGLWLEELGAVASSVAGIEPTWDTGRKRWYADVLLPGPAWRSYGPFVRLALARYQHFSTTAELKLSRVVTADFAQLIPDRTLRVDWVGDSNDLIDVSLAGVAPDGPNPNRVEVTIEHHDGAIPGELGWKPLPDRRPIVLDEGVRHPGRFLEQLHVTEAVQEALGLRRLFDQPGEHRHDPIDVGHLPTVARAYVEKLRVIPDWIDLQDNVPLLLFPGHHLWSAQIKLPVKRGSQPLRLVVREFETYETDAEAVGSSFVEPRIYHARRVVFAEFVEL